MTFPTHCRRALVCKSLTPKRAILYIRCDFCPAKIEATKKQARAAGWNTRWQGGYGGVQHQVDVCPECRAKWRKLPGSAVSDQDLNNPQ